MRARPHYALACAVVLGGCALGCANKSNPTGGPDGGSSVAPVSTLIADGGVLNATTVPTAYVQKGVNPNNLPVYNGPTGSVEGIVRKYGPPAPKLGLSSATFVGCPSAEAEYGTAFRESEPDPSGKRQLFDAVVLVTGYNGFIVPEKDEAELVEIRNCGYTRRTVVMTFGQRLEVKNLTTEFWVPELDPKSPGAMMMATPNGDAVKLYPKQPGRYHLIDHDRKYVIDDLLVVQQPLHAVTDSNGHYRIDGIPVGKMTVSVRHPQIPDSVASSEVDIREGTVAQMDLTMTYAPPTPRDAGTDSGFVPYPGLK